MANAEYLQSTTPVTRLCASDLSAYKNRLVDINSSGKIALATAGGRVFGVMAYGVAADSPAPVQCLGAPYVEFGGTVTPGAVKSDSVGRAVQASAADVQAGLACGFALDGGAVGERGAVQLFSGSKITGGVEAITGAGALSVLTDESTLAITGTIALTLADGTLVGQQKRIRVISAASTPLATLTIATRFGSEPATHVFTDVGQELVLEWTATGWKVIRKIRAGVQAVVVGTTVLTGFDMAAMYLLSVTGTVASLTTKGIPDGLQPGERIVIGCGTAASTPVGSIAFTGRKVDNTSLSLLSAIDATTDTATLQWDGAKWIVESQNGITLS